jgi:hypothetical protein
MYKREADAYLVGKMAECIWKEEWNKDLFAMDMVSGEVIYIYFQNHVRANF